ncbi:MAG: mucoidy inhibitor MuiA family protein, partial [Bacteroidales bacterium]|nr:mucoidy inhibitor MuiA family protein [Bacteroidales bacterium]
SEYYRASLNRLRFGELQRNKDLQKLREELQDVLYQINTITGRKEFPSGEIIVVAETKSVLSSEFELSYLVSNASWFPTYDIRARNVSEPVDIIYKANVRQDTKVDWKDINITLSTTDPRVSGVAPDMTPWYLNYNALPPVYSKGISQVSGKTTDQAGQPLPGVSIIVHGSTIGTISDMQGNYSLTLPANASMLTVSYVGFQTQEVIVDNPYKNIQLMEDGSSLDEIVVTGFGSNKKSMAQDALQAENAGVMMAIDESVRIRGATSYIPETVQTQNQTSMEFRIQTPYTVRSDNKSYSVDMSALSLPAYYEYFCVPKIDKDAFLIANIVDWEQYSFLEGEASIFFENTYVGKSILDVRFVSDTLKISLGRDKKILVEREKEKEFTSKKMLGSKKEDTRAWKISLKNNKTETINMVLLDQVPLSTIEEIEVNLQNASGAKHDIKTGELKWDLKLQPSEKKELKFRYTVKYPSNRNLIIE